MHAFKKYHVCNLMGQILTWSKLLWRGTFSEPGCPCPAAPSTGSEQHTSPGSGLAADGNSPAPFPGLLIPFFSPNAGFQRHLVALTSYHSWAAPHPSTLLFLRGWTAKSRFPGCLLFAPWMRFTFFLALDVYVQHCVTASHVQLSLGYGCKHQCCRRDLCRGATGVRALPDWCCHRRSVFSPHAAPRTGTSAANEAQCCLVAGFLVVFFIVSFDDNVAKRNIKQKLFCEKQGKGSVDAWQKMGHGLNPRVL